MLYNARERRYTRPSKWMDKGSRRKPRMQERDNRGEVMSFSVDFLPGFSDERGSMTPVYVADRCARPQQGWTQPTQRPITAFDTERRSAPLISHEGVNQWAGVWLLIAIAFILALVFAFSFAEVHKMSREVNQSHDHIAVIQQQIADLERTIAETASERNVSASAVEMGMISARGVDVIFLKAPETAMSNPGTGTLSAEYLSAVFGE